MTNTAIQDFLDSKKESFVKKHSKANFDEYEKLTIKQKASNQFSLKNWLVDSSNRASQLFITTHPAKFSHPDAKVTSLIYHGRHRNDGLFRSGNAEVDSDVFGNAAALDVEKFLRIQLKDNKTILNHLEENTDEIKKIFDIENYDEIRNNFLQIKASNLDQTSEKIKQVYFPVDDNYHLLSILTPSGMIFKLKQRINEIRFSENNSIAREALKKTLPISTILEDIPNLTSIGYGGTQPQNISTLNSKNGGGSFLLSSIPPQLVKRAIQPPKHNFFTDCLWPNLFKEEFKHFHAILAIYKNNIDIRNKRDEIVLNSIFKIKRIVDSIRQIDAGWSDSETYQNLDSCSWQKIWLDDKYKNIRESAEKNKDYVSKVKNEFANWFINNYKISVEKNKTLGRDDIEQIKSILENEQELLK